MSSPSTNTPVCLTNDSSELEESQQFVLEATGCQPNTLVIKRVLSVARESTKQCEEWLSAIANGRTKLADVIRKWSKAHSLVLAHLSLHVEHKDQLQVALESIEAKLRTACLTIQVGFAKLGNDVAPLTACSKCFKELSQRPKRNHIVANSILEYLQLNSLFQWPDCLFNKRSTKNLKTWFVCGACEGKFQEQPMINLVKRIYRDKQMNADAFLLQELPKKLGPFKVTDVKACGDLVLRALLCPIPCPSNHTLAGARNNIERIANLPADSFYHRAIAALKSSNATDLMEIRLLLLPKKLSDPDLTLAIHSSLHWVTAKDSNIVFVHFGVIVVAAAFKGSSLFDHDDHWILVASTAGQQAISIPKSMDRLGEPWSAATEIVILHLKDIGQKIRRPLRLRQWIKDFSTPTHISTSKTQKQQ